MRQLVVGGKEKRKTRITEFVKRERERVSKTRNKTERERQ